MIKNVFDENNCSSMSFDHDACLWWVFVTLGLVSHDEQGYFCEQISWICTSIESASKLGGNGVWTEL